MESKTVNPNSAEGGTCGEDSLTDAERVERAREAKRLRASLPLPDPSRLRQIDRNGYLSDVADECRDAFYGRLAHGVHGSGKRTRSDWGCVFVSGGGKRDVNFLVASDQSSLLELVRLWIYYACVGNPEYRTTITMWRLLVAIDGWRLGAMDWQKLVWALDVAISAYGEISWIGSLEELVTGEEAFARQARKSFREECSPGRADGVSDLEGPLREEEVGSFLQAVQEHKMPAFGAHAFSVRQDFNWWIR